MKKKKYIYIFKTTEIRFNFLLFRIVKSISYISDFRPEKGVCTAEGSCSPVHGGSLSPSLPLQKPDSPKSTASLCRTIPIDAYNIPHLGLGLHPVIKSTVRNLNKDFTDLAEQENQLTANGISSVGLLHFQRILVDKRRQENVLRENTAFGSDKTCKPIDLCNKPKDVELDCHACPDCGKRYSTSSNLARHRQTHRSITDKKARKCPHCDKVYVSMPAFSMHVRTHNQGCQCPHCGKCFSRPWLLQGHIRTHTGEKPFKCNTCNKAFADKSNLRAHVQTHSNAKPFVCGRCGKAFALKSYLYKHEESSCMKINRQPNLMDRLNGTTQIQTFS